MLRWLVRLISHGAALGIGFLAGIYALPLLIAPKGPDAAVVQGATAAALYKGRFERNLKGSDFLHWGEGDVFLLRDGIVHSGRLAPGPDYRLYLTPRFVETKEEFLAVKGASRLVGEVRSFDGFVVVVPHDIDVNAFDSVVVWCEAFGAFITAARYR